MVLFNYSTKELTAKVVYYGPGLCGKTTNLQYIHANLPGQVKGKMLSLATKTDRTLFFDFLPIDLGEIRGMQTRVQLYTVPGQVFYNETRKLVLKGADGIVFVADSQEQMIKANVESFKNLEDNLRGHGLELSQMPHVIQFNKRDLPKLATIEQMNGTVNKYNAPFYESVATTGIGVQDTLKAITKLVLLHLTKKYDPKAAGARPKATAPRPAAPPAPVVQPTPRPMPAPAYSSVPLAPGTLDPGAATMQIPVAETPPAAPMSAQAPSAPAPPAAAPMPAEPAPAVAAAVEQHRPTVPEVPPAVALGGDEIDSMMNEVPRSAQPEMAPAPAAAPPRDVVPMDSRGESVEELSVAIDDRDSGGPAMAPRFEVDMSVDPQGSEFAQGFAKPQVTLTEVVSDDDLFNDPNLEIARMAPGDTREILVPVEVGDPQVGGKRLRLSLKIRLEP